MATNPRLELPSGGWVEFNDPDVSIRAKQVKQLAVLADDDETLPVPALFAGAELLVPVVVTGWKVPYTDVAFTAANAIDELTAADFKALMDAIMPAMFAAIEGKPYTPTEAATEAATEAVSEAASGG